jgi:hypothetical protein
MAYPEKRVPLNPIAPHDNRENRRQRKEDHENPSVKQTDKSVSLMLAIGAILFLITLYGAYYANTHKTPSKRFTANTEIPKIPSAVDSTKIPTIRAKPSEHGK